MDNKIKMTLLVRGLGNKKNNCVDLLLPCNDENAIKMELAKVCDENNSLCNMIKYTSNCKIKLDDNIDVFKLNKKLLELDSLASAEEITAVSEYLDMKSKCEEYTCKDYKGVTIDEIIDKVKAKDYKFYTNKEYLDSTDDMAIYDQLFYPYEDTQEIIQRLDDELGIFDRFGIREVIDLFDDDELVEHFAENGFCIATSTGAIEEITKNDEEGTADGN